MSEETGEEQWKALHLFLVYAMNGFDLDNFIPIHQTHSYCRKPFLSLRQDMPDRTTGCHTIISSTEPAGGEIPVELVAASRLMTSLSGPGCRGQIGLL